MTFPSLTASGSLATPQYLLYRMVILSPTFQGEFDDDIDDAADRVGFGDIDFTESRPVAVINPVDHGWNLASGGQQNYLRPMGSLALYLAIDANGNDDKQSELTAMTFFGGVIDDIAGFAGADQVDDATNTVSHLMIKSIDLEGFTRVPEEERGTMGDFYFAIYRIEWGD